MDLPFIDELQTDARAAAGTVFLEVAGRIGRSFEGGGARVFSWLLGCVHRGVSFTVPPVTGQEASGFRVAKVDVPSELVLEGQHRFAIYRLSFFIDVLDDNTCRVRARTDAAFPGIKGAAYRALVIGSGAHAIVVRRMLSAIARRAERHAGDGSAK